MMSATTYTDALAQALDAVIPEAIVVSEVSTVLKAARDEGRAISLTDGETVNVPENADLVTTSKAIFCERLERANPAGYCFQIAVGGFVQGDGVSSAAICFARVFFDRSASRIGLEFYKAMR